MNQVLATEGAVNGTAVAHGAGEYEASFVAVQLGIHILGVYLNGVQIPNSPILFQASCLQSFLPYVPLGLLFVCLLSNILFMTPAYLQFPYM